MGTYDVRAVANQVLAEAYRSRRSVTHLSLQKICFFVHGMYLASSGIDLIEGEFEAWTYGPVHRVLFHALQAQRDRPVTVLISRVDPITGKVRDVPKIAKQEDTKFIVEVASFFLGFTAGQLVEMSHAQGTPWHKVWEQAKTNPNVGMRISNALVRDFYMNSRLTN